MGGPGGRSGFGPIAHKVNQIRTNAGSTVSRAYKTPDQPTRNSHRRTTNAGSQAAQTRLQTKQLTILTVKRQTRHPDPTACLSNTNVQTPAADYRLQNGLEKQR
jgi:hypothetical protein